MDIAAGLVGRGAELAGLHDFVAEAEGAGCLVLEGAAGVGKSALWEATIASAREHGRTVLTCRPAAEEARFDFSGLADLFAGVPDTVRAELPAPQSRALEAALLLGDRAEDADARAVSTGTLSVLRSLIAKFGPLLIAVDDVQWLDPASAGALTFALRRLRDNPVRVLMTRRVPGSSASVVERVLRPTVLTVAPMSSAGIGRLLQARLGVTFSRATSGRIYERSGGNPLFALELARVVIDRGGRVDAADDLPLPAAVESALAERLNSLTPAVRRVLLVAELAGAVPAIELDQVTAADAVDDAVAAGVVTLTGGRIRPAHPLLGAAAKAAAPGPELRAMHASMAEAALDTEHAARHRALALRHPDEETAAIVAAAAEQASRRGASASAAELGEYALRLTPPDARSWAERLLMSAQYSFVVGELGRVRELLKDTVGRLPDADSRARALLLLVDADQDAGAQTPETPCLLRALAETEGSPALRSRVLRRLAMHAAVARVVQLPQAMDWAQEAVRLAAGAGDPAAERAALMQVMWARHMRGQASDAELRRYRSLVGGVPDLTHLSADRAQAVRAIWRGDLADARAILDALLVQAEARGEAESYFVIRVQLCELEMRAGRWDALRALLEDWAVEQEEPVGNSASYVRCSAQLAVGLGRVPDAKRLAAEAIALAVKAGTIWHRLEGLRALGMAESLAGEYDAAAGHLTEVWEHTSLHGIDDPGVFPVAPELVEARAAAGDVRGALEVTEHLEAFAAGQDHPWAAATASRCRGLVLLAQRREADAEQELESAAAQFGRLGMPFDAARTLITLGITRRRLKLLRAGREALQTAVGMLTGLGSDGWAARAQAELDRFGGRRTAAGLTPTEERVAGLVASGLSNKLVAREMAVSVSAVERHLTRIYEKLGVRSRTELVRRRAEDGPGGQSVG
jgi:DNA-binding NarL/FixJ family response regulator